MLVSAELTDAGKSPLAASWTAAPTLRNPPSMSALPLASGDAVERSRDATWGADRLGATDSTRAAAAETRGTAKDVPLSTA